MRALKNFTAGEWLQLLPLQHAFKQARNDAYLSIYKKIRPGSLKAFLADARRLENKNIALVVAFEQPWALDWLLRMAERNLTDGTVLVFDNSRPGPAKAEIARVCQARSVPYLALPRNPTRHVNRSHGMAMTWIFHNVVRAIRPRIFGFIDHDLIPVEKTSLSERLGDQPFFGRQKGGSWAWTIWAGYCLYDFATVANLPLNFLYDFSQKLDTGGRNWKCLYRHYDRTRLRSVETRFADVVDPATGESRAVHLFDDRWLHIGSIGYNDNFTAKSPFYELLAQAMDGGMTLSQLSPGTVASP